MTYDNCRDSIMEFWSCCNSVDLTNYYTKQEVDEKIADISGLTPSDVQQLINQAIAPIEEALDNVYTKQETNALIANYSAIDDTTLILNNQNITL